jgi:hypothetical protein
MTPTALTAWMGNKKMKRYLVELTADDGHKQQLGPYTSRVQAVGKARRESQKDGGRFAFVVPMVRPYGHIAYFNGYVDHTDGAPV